MAKCIGWPGVFQKELHLESGRWSTNQYLEGHNWLPAGSQDLKIQTPRGRNLVSNVDELINSIDVNWDVDLLRSLFLPVDVQRILKIPLSQGREDVA